MRMGAKISAHWRLFKGRVPINVHRTARSRSSQMAKMVNLVLSWCLIMLGDSMRAAVGKRLAPFFYDFVLRLACD